MVRESSPSRLSTSPIAASTGVLRQQDLTEREMGQTVRDKDTNADERVAKRTRILSKQPPPSRSAVSKEQDG